MLGFADTLHGLDLFGIGTTAVFIELHAPLRCMIFALKPNPRQRSP